MDNDARKAHIEEMNRLADAIYRTKSPFLKRDYAKALNRMERELKEYDLYMIQHGECKNQKLEVKNG